MNKKSEKITADKQKLLNQYKEYWTKVDFSTEPACKERAENALKEIYKIGGYKVPKFSWFPSPMAAQLYINKEAGNCPKQVYKSFCEKWPGWEIGYFLFMEATGANYGESQRTLLHLQAEVASSCGEVYTFITDCMICDRPKTMIMKDGKFHSETGMAIEFRDGYGVYCLNGKRYSEKEWEKEVELLNLKKS